MKIVVLDGATANPGDLSWAGLNTLGEVTFYDRTPPEALLERAAGAEVLLTNKTVLNKASLEALPDLIYIGVLATGTNVVDLAAARTRGVTVTNVPAYSTMSVAQQVFALLLELTNRVGLHNDSVHSGAWVRSKDFCFTRSPLTELDGLTLGIVGLGSIGKAVAAIGTAFGMKVIASSRSPKTIPGIALVNRDTLFAEADVVSLHCPLTEETKGIINEASLAAMKSTALLINTGRGPLVNEPALAHALKEGIIAGAGLDVLSTEPPAADNPLLTAPNCVITPHIAWATRAARTRLLNTAMANIKEFLRGNPQNQVN